MTELTWPQSPAILTDGAVSRGQSGSDLAGLLPLTVGRSAVVNFLASSEVPALDVVL